MPSKHANKSPSSGFQAVSVPGLAGRIRLGLEVVIRAPWLRGATGSTVWVPPKLPTMRKNGSGTIKWIHFDARVAKLIRVSRRRNQLATTVRACFNYRHCSYKCPLL